MKFKQLLTEDDGVSPVIGVILMVAITVILAAVIASFVLGLGDTSDDIQPNTNFNLEYDAVGDDFIGHFEDEVDLLEQNSSYLDLDDDTGAFTSDTDDPTDGGLLTVSVSDGESVKASELVLRGDSLFAAGDGETLEEVDEIAVDELGDVDADEEFSAGQSFTIVVDGDFDVNVVWEATDSDSSSTLAEREGPDA